MEKVNSLEDLFDMVYEKDGNSEFVKIYDDLQKIMSNTKGSYSLEKLISIIDIELTYHDLYDKISLLKKSINMFNEYYDMRLIDLLFFNTLEIEVLNSRNKG